jgi:hypothetical protein
MTILRPRSLYDVLNVSVEAEPVVIEAAYKALMKRYHPDQKDGAAISRDAAEINEAYATLKDPGRRAEYDHRLWTRDEVLRAAAADLVPPRPSRLFGWTGWAMAALLGCAAIGLTMSNDSSPAAHVAAAQVAGTGAPEDKPAAVAAVFDEEAIPAATTEAPDVADALPAAAAATAVGAAIIAAPAVPTAESKPAPRVRAKPVRTPRAAATRWTRAVRRPAAPRKSGRPAAVKDKAFLEREGYIY